MKRYIKDIHGLAEVVGVEEQANEMYDVKRFSDEKLERLIADSLCDTTDSGTYICFQDDGIILGAIVEGCQIGTDTIKLCYGKFTGNDFWETIKEGERQADAIWNASHGCDDCGRDGAINPDCKSCDGHGAII